MEKYQHYIDVRGEKLVGFYIVCKIYQSPLILTELFQHNLINVSYIMACYLYFLHFLNDVANDVESTQNQILRHNR